MKKIIIVLSFFVFAHSFVNGQCVPANAGNDYISRAVAMVNYNGFNFTGFLVNNSNEDGKLYFVTSSYPFNSFCGIGNATSGHISNISFKWVNGITTSGATVIGGTSYEVIVLELDNPPPFSSYSLLGFTLQASNSNYCLSNFAGGNLKNLNVQSITTGYVTTNCNPGGTNTYTFTNGIDNDAFIVQKWVDGKNLEKLNYSKGAPLFNSSGQVVGMYVTKTIDTLCGYENAFFLSNPSNNGNLASILGASPLRGIKYTPCLDEEIKTGIINTAQTVTATIRIIGKSKINNVAVIFRAGVEVVLENGFDSGDNFIAEIAPCFPKVEEISAKTDEYYSLSNVEETSVKITNVKAYPTVLIDDKIIIESEGLDYFDYLIYDITGKIIKKENSISNNRLNVFLPQISKGIYYLKINALNYSQTIKLIKE